MAIAAILLVSAGFTVATLIGSLWISPRSRSMKLALLSGGIALYAIACSMRPPAWIGLDLAIVIVAIVCGSAVAAKLGSMPALAGFAAAAATADLISFTTGATRRTIENFARGKSLTLAYLSVTIDLHGAVVPLIGIADLFFLAMFISALARLRFPIFEAAAILIVAMSLALAAGLYFHGVPALPFLGGGVVLYIVLRGRSVAGTPR